MSSDMIRRMFGRFAGAASSERVARRAPEKNSSRFISTLLLHQAHQVAIGIADKSRPQLVIGHFGGELRSAFAFGAARDDRGMSGSDIGGREIEDGILAHGTSALWRRQHDANAARGKESEIG